MHDSPGPSVRAFLDDRLKGSHLVAGDDADSCKAFTDHVGLNASGYSMEKTLNPTLPRARGYGVGGIMSSKKDDKDAFYVHPGHALNKDKVGRFEGQKKLHLWDGTEDGSNPIPQPIRSPFVN
jgi:hypothetical protein